MKCDDCDNDAVAFIQIFTPHWSDQGSLCEPCAAKARAYVMPYLLLEAGGIIETPLEAPLERTDDGACNNCTLDPWGNRRDQPPEAGPGPLHSEVSNG